MQTVPLCKLFRGLVAGTCPLLCVDLEVFRKTLDEHVNLARCIPVRTFFRVLCWPMDDP